jgi:mRNA interferase RelE/StbE
LTGRLSGYWFYRVGDYRIIADIQDHRFTILAISIDHRRQIYDY